MSDQQVFFKAIRQERPTDQAPSLIYADWLEEQGEHGRASLIRTQVELASLGCSGFPYEDGLWRKGIRGFEEWDWSSITNPARCAWLWRKQRELLAENWNAWREAETKPHPALEWGPFQKGLIREAQLHWENLADFDAVKHLKCSAVSSLCINNEHNKPFSIDAAKQLVKNSSGQGFRELTIRASTIEPGAIQVLADSAAWSELKRLTWITWERQNLAREIQAAVQEPCWAGLETLELPANNLVLPALANFNRLKHLKTLSLRGTVRVALLSEALASPNLNQVQDWRLALSLTDKMAQPFSELPAGNRIRELRLIDYSDLGPDGAKLLVSSQALQGLKVLGLSGNEIGDQGVLALSQSKNMKALRFLDLESVGLKNRGLKDLFAAHFMPRLVTLKLGCNLFKLGALASLGRAIDSSRPLALRNLDLGLHSEVCYKSPRPRSEFTWKPLPVKELLSTPLMKNLLRFGLAEQFRFSEAAGAAVLDSDVNQSLLSLSLNGSLNDSQRIPFADWANQGCLVSLQEMKNWWDSHRRIRVCLDLQFCSA